MKVRIAGSAQTFDVRDGHLIPLAGVHADAELIMMTDERATYPVVTSVKKSVRRRTEKVSEDVEEEPVE